MVGQPSIPISLEVRFQCQDHNRCFFAQRDGHRVGCCQILQALPLVFRPFTIEGDQISSTFSRHQEVTALTVPNGETLWQACQYQCGVVVA